PHRPSMAHAGTEEYNSGLSQNVPNPLRRSDWFSMECGDLPPLLATKLANERQTIRNHFNTALSCSKAANGRRTPYRRSLSSVLREHYFGGFDHCGYRLALLESHLVDALPCDHGFNQILSYLTVTFAMTSAI